MSNALEQLLNNWKLIAPLALALTGGGVQTFRVNTESDARQGNAAARFECIDQLAKEQTEHKECREHARTDTGALRDDLFHCLESGGMLQP